MLAHCALCNVQCALCSGLHWFPVQVVSASPVVNSGNCFHCIHRIFKHNHCTLLKSKTYIMYTTHTSLHLQLYNATMKHILCFPVCNPMLSRSQSRYRHGIARHGIARSILKTRHGPGAAGGGSRRKAAIREISKSQQAPPAGLHCRLQMVVN